MIAVGRTSAGLPLFVAFTLRVEDCRRLIRPVTAYEAYEKEESSKAQNR